MSQTILIPSFKSRITRLNGLKTGVSSGDRRTPASTPVVWEYLGSEINRVSAYRQVMLYSPDDPRIDRTSASVWRRRVWRTGCLASSESCVLTLVAAVVDRAVELGLAAPDQGGGHQVAGDVHRGARHVEDAVDPGDQRHAFQRQAGGGEHQAEHDQPGAGNAGGADGVPASR